MSRFLSYLKIMKNTQDYRQNAPEAPPPPKPKEPFTSRHAHLIVLLILITCPTLCTVTAGFGYTFVSDPSPWWRIAAFGAWGTAAAFLMLSFYLWVNAGELVKDLEGKP